MPRAPLKLYHVEGLAIAASPVSERVLTTLRAKATLGRFTVHTVSPRRALVEDHGRAAPAGSAGEMNFRQDRCCSAQCGIIGPIMGSVSVQKPATLLHRKVRVFSTNPPKRVAAWPSRSCELGSNARFAPL
jgi:hypothetical protein